MNGELPRRTAMIALDHRPRLVARDVTTELADGTRLLDGVSLDVRPGEIATIIGRSGAGKSTLLDTLAGLRAPTSGTVDLVGADGEVALGYVPQEDIVHRELTVEATLRYSARLRLPPGTPAAELERIVSRILHVLGLTHVRRRAVSELSGGQRKRVSIATELVVQPHVCFLDEPTAGLDPLAAAEVMDVLRSLADRGTTIVTTTHNLADLRVVDRLIVLADGGRVVFDGPPTAAPEHFGVDDVVDVCRAVSTSGGGGWRGSATGHHRFPPGPDREAVSSRSMGTARRRSSRRPGEMLVQWRILARRNVDVMVRNRMTLAITAGSPILIVAMFAVLFRPGAFDGAVSDAGASVAITYWMAFAGFFFGLTFGLLQICTEIAIARRELLTTIGVGPYVLAKAAVLVPVLGGVNVMMAITLVALDRLPALDPAQFAVLLGLLMLDSVAGLALGLLASASVTSPAQAALALPMLCFPAVLFSGAVLPLRSMTPAGRAIGAVTSDRWAFEAIARAIDLDVTLSGSAAGRQIAAAHGGAFSGPLLPHLQLMLVLTALFLAVACRVVRTRHSVTPNNPTRSNPRRRHLTRNSAG